MFDRNELNSSIKVEFDNNNCKFAFIKNVNEDLYEKFG